MILRRILFYTQEDFDDASSNLFYSCLPHLNWRSRKNPLIKTNISSDVVRFLKLLASVASAMREFNVSSLVAVI